MRHGVGSIAIVRAGKTLLCKIKPSSLPAALRTQQCGSGSIHLDAESRWFAHLRRDRGIMNFGLRRDGKGELMSLGAVGRWEAAGLDEILFSRLKVEGTAKQEK